MSHVGSGWIGIGIVGEEIGGGLGSGPLILDGGSASATFSPFTDMILDNNSASFPAGTFAAYFDFNAV